MLDRILTPLLGRREGLLVVIASVGYLVVGVTAMLVPSVVPLTDFYAWFCRFMPIPLLLVYLKMGGFKKNYEASGFNFGLIVFTALIPILLRLKTMLWH